jgi:hypothetical protein
MAAVFAYAFRGLYLNVILTTLLMPDGGDYTRI